MEIVSYILLVIIGLAFAALSIFFILLIAKNVRQGKVVRQQLALRVESLRMSKMLGALGLDFSKYLHKVPLNQINSSMSKCENCDALEKCDEKLRQDIVKPEEIDFCPNHECIGQFTELKKQEAL